MIIDGYFRVPPTWVTGGHGVQKFGENPDIDSGGVGDVWDGGGVYAWPAAATAMTISSSSADDADGGTGAQDVTIHIQDINNVESLINLALNGQTPVDLPVDPFRVYRAWVGEMGAHASGANVGDIWIGSGTVTAGVPATKYAGIRAGEGQTLMAIYTIPSYVIDEDGDLMQVARARILRWGTTAGSSKTAFCTSRLQTRATPTSAWRTRDKIGVGEGVSPEGKSLAFGTVLSPGADIRINISENTDNDTTVQGGFDIYLEKTP